MKKLGLVLGAFVCAASFAGVLLGNAQPARAVAALACSNFNQTLSILLSEKFDVVSIDLKAGDTVTFSTVGNAVAPPTFRIASKASNAPIANINDTTNSGATLTTVQFVAQRDAIDSFNINLDPDHNANDSSVIINVLVTCDDGTGNALAPAQQRTNVNKSAQNVFDSISPISNLGGSRAAALVNGSGFVINPVSNSTTAQSTNTGLRGFQLTRHGNQSGSFVANLNDMVVTPAASHRQGLPKDVDIWLSGKVSLLDDGSSAKRKGYSGNLSFGVARKINDKLAIAAEVTGRSGKVDIDQIASKTDYKGLGVALSGAYALSQKVRLSLTGFYERGDFDTSLAGATGSFNSNRFGASADLTGGFKAGDFLLQPGLSLSYTTTKQDSYTDSAAVFTASQKDNRGNLNSSLRISRTLSADGEKLINWQPFVIGRFHYDFSKQSRFAISPTLVVNDSRTNAELGGGAQFNFIGGSKASIGATYYGLFGKGANAINIGANLHIPLN